MIGKYRTFLAIFGVFFLGLSACGGGSSTSSIDTSNFDGVWYGPCINNTFGFSAKQKITLNGSTLISEITSYTAGANSAEDCSLPGTGGTIIDTDVTAKINFGGLTNHSGCINNDAKTSTITLERFDSSGNTTLTTQPEMSDGVQLVTGSRNDFLPDTSDVCITSDRKLLFAGHKYWGTPNTTIIDAYPTIDTTVKWQLGNHRYKGGVDGSSSDTSSLDDYDYGIVAVGTTGLQRLNGDWSGSVISIAHSLQGSGTYTLVDGAGGLIDAANSNPTGKIMTLDVTVGTLNTNPTALAKYKATSGSVRVTVDRQGKYHFFIHSPVTLEKSLEIGEPLSGASDTISFTMNNIYDYSD